MADDELRGDLQPLARNSSAFSLVLAASSSPSSSKSTRAGDTYAPSRVQASASPAGEATAGRTSPSEPSPGSPSVCYVTLQGLPHGSPARDVAAPTGLPVRSPRTSSSHTLLAAPPGLPYGSPAGSSASRPLSPALSGSLGSVLSSHVSGLRYVSNALAAVPRVSAAWPTLSASFYEPRDYPVFSTMPPQTFALAGPFSVSDGDIGVTAGPGRVSPAESASSVDTVASDDSTPGSRRRRRGDRSPDSDETHPAPSSSSSCTLRGGGGHGHR